MAAILPDLQRFEDFRNGTIIGVHFVTLTSSSDTITVPKLANTTNNASSAQVRRAGEGAVTVTDDGDNTVTIAGGTAGDKAVIVTAHGPATINFGDED